MQAPGKALLRLNAVSEVIDIKVGSWVADMYHEVWYTDKVEGEEDEDEVVIAICCARFMHRLETVFWDSRLDILNPFPHDVFCTYPA